MTAKPMHIASLRILTIALLLACTSVVFAQGRFGQMINPTNPKGEGQYLKAGLPDILSDVGFDQNLDHQLTTSLKFRDEEGREVRLADYFGTRPVVLSLVYYECPMLCNQVLNGLLGSMKALEFSAGKEFDVITVSFDTNDTPDLAKAKKNSYLARYKRPTAEAGWHFLTGDSASIAQLAHEVGFRYRWDETSEQFAHASGIMVVTPEGKLSKYFYGIEYAPKDLKFGIMEASENRIGTAMDQMMLYCYHYDPATGKYGTIVMRLVGFGGALTVVAMAGLFVVLRRKNQHRMNTAQLGKIDSDIETGEQERTNNV